MSSDTLLHRTGRHLWREWIRLLALPLLLIAAAKSALADINYVPSGSMHPTLIEGDVVFVNKLAYDLRVPFTFTRLARWAEPARGDIVVCFEPQDGTRLVKRVIGVAGDTIELHNNVLFLNGRQVGYELLPSSAGKDLTEPERNASLFATEELATHPHTVMRMRWPMPSGNFGPITVPAGSCFMMGDNRDNSFDSRYWGTVDRSQIVGRATAVAISFDKQHHWQPRWDRWFTSLYPDKAERE